MSKVVEFDDVDIACINALICNPRGTWRELSVISGIPEKKLSRRITRLLDDQIIRSSIELNPVVVNKGFTVHVWLSVACGKEKEVAQFFSQQPEVRIVFLTTGKADIFLEVGFEREADLSIWMHDLISQKSDIKTIETQVVLKPFTWASKRKKETSFTEHEFSVRSLVEEEIKLIGILANDARISIKNLSEQIGLSEHRTQKLLNDLLNEEVFSLRIDFEPRLIGFKSEAIIQIKVQSEHAHRIAKILSELPYTRCLFGVSGDSQFFWHVLCNDHADLWQVMTDELGKLEGIQSCKTTMIMSAYKRAGFMRKGLVI